MSSCTLGTMERDVGLLRQRAIVAPKSDVGSRSGGINICEKERGTQIAVGGGGTIL